MRKELNFTSSDLGDKILLCGYLLKKPYETTSEVSKVTSNPDNRKLLETEYA
jgi:hypothetical protein